jgi:hypothetical protein
VTPRPPPGRKAIDAALLTALEGHVETLKAQLAATEGKASEDASATLGRRDRTAEAIGAFKNLAERLEAIAETRRPWWHRMLWSG